MKETITPKIEIRKVSIVNVVVEAIVNPANSSGYMAGGVSEAIKSVGGNDIEEEAINIGPIPVGEARMTGAGDLICQYIIHAPTIEKPFEKTDSHKVLCAACAALELADENGIRSIAIPGIGAGQGGLDKDEVAKAIITAIKQTEFQSIEKIMLIDIDDEMIKAFEDASGKLKG